MRLYPIVCPCIWVDGKWSKYLQVIAVPKVSARDTVFTTTDHQGRSFNVPIPAKTPLSVDIVALHHNRKHLLVDEPDKCLLPKLGSEVLAGSPGVQS